MTVSASQPPTSLVQWASAVCTVHMPQAVDDSYFARQGQTLRMPLDREKLPENTAQVTLRLL